MEAVAPRRQRRGELKLGAKFAGWPCMSSTFKLPPVPQLRIVIVAPDSLGDDLSDPDDVAVQAERSRSLRMGLLEGGYNIVAVLPADVFLPDRLAQIGPDMVIIDAESQARDTLEHVVMATRDARRPIVMFTNDDDTSHVPEAIAAGVTAYVVAGLAPERVRPVLDVAMARFRHEESLRRELADARLQLSDRKLIDRAKGVLMKRQNLGEEEAYSRLRKTAMDKGLKIADVAQRILDVADLM
jgi:response regulator NasT